jgi:phage N-6-adenine-methyltransferase
MFSSKTDCWATPLDFFKKLDLEFGFETDVCALPDNAKCARYFTPEVDGLAQTWAGVCWMNPPYGREIGKWIPADISVAISPTFYGFLENHRG